MHYSLQLVEELHCLRILKLFKAVEHLYEAWMDTREIRIINAAIKLVNPSTFQIKRTKPTSKTTGFSSIIYGALATGLNVYLNAHTHTDKDFTFSAIMLCMKKEYNIEDDVVAYFCFPGLGIVVPLRPGGVLFLNPRIHHCVSSRCNNVDQVYCLSLYLKSDNIVKHANRVKFLPMENCFLGEGSI